MRTRLDPIVEFREDHRKVRDLLLNLARALEEGQIAQARTALWDMNVLIGPHFRYEEEALYPALREFLGEYVDSLIEEHDGAIKAALAVSSLLSQPAVSSEEAKGAAKGARALLVHVTNCDGLNILAERLSSAQLDHLARCYEEARAEGVSLLQWADTIRKRPHIS